MKAKPSNTRGILSFSAKFHLKSGPYMYICPVVEQQMKWIFICRSYTSVPLIYKVKTCQWNYSSYKKFQPEWWKVNCGLMCCLILVKNKHLLLLIFLFFFFSFFLRGS